MIKTSPCETHWLFKAVCPDSMNRLNFAKLFSNDGIVINEKAVQACKSKTVFFEKLIKTTILEQKQKFSYYDFLS